MSQHICMNGSISYLGISNVVKKLFWQTMFSFMPPTKGLWILTKYQTQSNSVLYKIRLLILVKHRHNF
nr:hypothetical protein Iba_chr04dCG15330 [Ipomoea batatas]